MPRYTYLCDDCKELFETIHSMSATQELCLLCGSSKINKVPAQIASKLVAKEQKVGDIVKEHIRSSKEDLIRDKTSSRKELET